MSYVCEITENENRHGNFKAVCGDISVAHSRDPEHDICRALIRAGETDGPVVFTRGGVAAMSHSSIAEMAKWLAIKIWLAPYCHKIYCQPQKALWLDRRLLLRPVLQSR